MRKFLVAVFVLLFAPPVFAQMSAVVGADTSINLGERPGIVLGLRAERKGPIALESQSLFDSSQKKDGGWKAGQELLVRFGTRFGAIAGADFRYRDGGLWVKKTVWLVVGAGRRSDQTDFRLLYRHPIFESYPNSVRQIVGEFRFEKPGNRIGLSLSEGAVFYRDYTGRPRRYGWFQDCHVIVALGKSGFPR